MQTDVQIDAHTALRDAATNLRDRGGNGYERDYAEAARRYQAVTGQNPSHVQPYGR